MIFFPSQVCEGGDEYDRLGGHLPVLHLPHPGGAGGLRHHWQDWKDHSTGEKSKSLQN